MKVTHKNVQLEIIRIETVASNKAENRTHLANHMEENGKLATLWVKRPRGSQLGMLTVYDKGESITWTGIRI